MTIVTMVSSRMAQAGYSVVTASRGDEALRLVHENRPRLVLLDVEMPGLDGVEVTRCIRSDEALAEDVHRAADQPLEESEIAAGMAAGADAYLTKPFSPQDLQTQVEQLIGTAKLER